MVVNYSCRYIQILLSALAISVGGVTYMIWRCGTLLYSLTSGIPAIKYLQSVCPYPGNFFIYNLPGGLWCLSYILVVDMIMRQSSLLLRLVAASIIPFVGLSSEVFQYFGLISGQFDYFDIICYLLPLAVYMIVMIVDNKK